MEKVEGVLVTLTAEDIAHITKDGKVTMTCSFAAVLLTLIPLILIVL